MTRADPDVEDIARLSQRVRELVGLDYPPNRFADLWRALQRVASDLGQSPDRFCAELLVATPASERLQALVRVLTVGETYLYREPSTLTALVSRALPEAIERRRSSRRLRLWSAACCTGEEAYMLAILAHQCVPDPEAWDIQVLGTDVNDHFLTRAQRARYGEWSFRDAPLWLRAGYFQRTEDGLFTPVAAIRERVTFARLNLVDAADAAWPPEDSIDIALCRNVMMYFSAEAMRTALTRIVPVIAPGGWFGVGLCERQPVRVAGLLPVDFDDTTLYRREDRSLAEPATASSPQGATRAVPSVAARVAPRWQARPAPASASIAAGLAQARMLADRGECSAALAICESLAAAEPMNGSARLLKAMVLTESGRVVAARIALREALYADDSLVMAHVGLGALAMGEGCRDEASRHYGRAAQLLAGLPPDSLVPQAGGLTVAQVAASIATMMAERGQALQ